MLAAVALLAAAPVPLTCGAVPRPGIAELGEDGAWRGTAVDICQRVASEQNGAGAPIVFHEYDSLPALRAASKDRLAFLSQDELAQTGMRAEWVAAIDRQVLTVRNESPVRTTRDLTDRTVCFIIGTRAESALNDWSAATHMRIKRLAFQEPVEMHDAYNVGKCAAMAVDETELVHEHGSRPLEPALAQVRIFVATENDTSADWQRAVAAVRSARQRAPH